MTTKTATKKTKVTIQEKGQRFVDRGAVRKISDGVFTVQGSQPKPYTVRDGRCLCPAYGRCSHAIAVELFVTKTKKPRYTGMTCVYCGLPADLNFECPDCASGNYE